MSWMVVLAALLVDVVSNGSVISQRHQFQQSHDLPKHRLHRAAPAQSAEYRDDGRPIQPHRNLAKANLKTDNASTKIAFLHSALSNDAWPSLKPSEREV